MDVGDVRDTRGTQTTQRPPADAAARATKPASAAAAPPRREMSSLKKYQILQKLGQGTFGVVQKAKNLDTGRLVALKQLLNHSAKEGFPITAMREITILKQLSHPNILELIDMVYEAPRLTSPSDAIHQRGCFYTVSPYMSSDLVGLLKNPKVELRVCDIKGLMQQLLRGVQYIHEQKFLHRDIKAANILVGHDGVLKIADFGLARAYHGHVPRAGEGPGGGERAYTALVVTRWYRPPELLLGETKYTTAVDLWGVGCVLGELFVGHPILVGKSDSHQAQLIFELVGGPSTIDWPHAVNLPNKADFSIGITCKRTLEAKFGRLMTPDGIALLSGLLTLNPYKRMNALDALNHEYFTNEPLPSQPSELPRFEECHEIDSERFKTASGAPVAPEPAVPSYFKGRAEPKPRPPYMSNYRQQQEYLNYSSRAGPPQARDTYVRRTKDLPPKRTAPGSEVPESKRRR
ncbi:Serine/threonine-protein kinase BUR1 [[Candida] zeylanoides]